MADKPSAEVRIDADLVRTLLADQQPDLAWLPLRLAAEGWDNATWRLGDSLAVRLPRRAASSALVHNEQHCLPLLAARIDLPLPVPVYSGVPSGLFPWHWSVVPWFSGRPAATVALDDRDPAAAGLARFLSQLHHPAPHDAPHNPFRGVDLAVRSADVLARLDDPTFPRAAEARALWTELSATPAWAGPRRWIHGDLHPYNIVLEAPERAVAPGPAVRAVIDFGDVTAGDPATDLATAWLTFGPGGRRTFVTSVTDACGTDAATWRRARAWALLMASALLAQSDDDPSFRRLGRTVLDQVLDDPVLDEGMPGRP
ncbi:aminoglycoside phosphotransferase family protein [Sanguibacter sp. 25GB23B1]|uniref:aminoglycoside phosphotransferase family protein n=1 Tax=unclassified Sanguibacter TaxID=2645534 RepID=UPI0032AF5B38